MSTEKPFLLDPRNQGVMEGTQRYHPIRYLEEPGFIFVVIPVFLVISVVITAFFIIPWGFSLWSQWWQLEHDGVEGTATVLSRQAPTDDESAYIVSYSFEHTPADGDPRRYADEDKVDSATYSRLEPGVTAPVWYVPDNPAISVLEPPRRPSILWTGVIGVLLLLWYGGFLSLLGEGIAHFRAAQRLAQHGQIITGTVTTHKIDQDDGNAYVTIQLNYRFCSPATGQELTGGKSINRYIRHVWPLSKTYVKDLEELPVPPEGGTVAIIYLNDELYDVL
jgi:hypothetical protein